MLHSFRKSLRALRYQMPFSIINIFGLSVGLVAIMLILIWVKTEISFDRFHANSKNIYRVNTISVSPNRQIEMGSINAPAGPEFKARFPAIKESLRIRPGSGSIKYNDMFVPVELLYVDSTFFKMLSFPLITGSPDDCLSSRDKVVLSESMAIRVFGSEEPIGKMLSINGQLLEVSAVAVDPPVNSSITFECLASMSILESKSYIGWDGGLNCLTLLSLLDGTDISLFEKDMSGYLDEVFNSRARPMGFESLPYLQSLARIHLYSDLDYDFVETGSISRVLTFSLTGLLILLIACFNFVNINTAISIKRTKEVGIKKIYGSGRRSIIWEFISESGLAIAISLLFASLFAKYLLPYFSQLVGTELSYSLLSVPEWIIAYLVLFILCTTLASFYGAWYISAILPISLLRDIFAGKRKQLSRNILVTTQFVISSGLIICTLIFYTQMMYTGNVDIGFSKANVVALPLSPERSKKADYLKESLLSIPGIESATKSAGGLPGFGLTSNGYQIEGTDEIILANCIYADPDYINTLGIKLKEGRDFRDSGADMHSLLVNETFVKMNNWIDPIDKTVTRNGIEYTVIGVVNDFHTSSLHNSIQPLVIPLYNEWGAYGNILIRTSGLPFNQIENKIEEIFMASDPESPFTYTILEDSMKSLYSKERYINILFLALSIIGIVVSCLGLFGLTTFSAQIRRREIGIRKVNGALIRDIAFSFSRELLSWIVVAFIIAIPLSYMIMNSWLTNFAYRVQIRSWMFILSGIIVLIIGIVSIASALIKELSRNPVELLRYQ